MTTTHAGDEVDRLIDERGGRELLRPVYDEQAVPITDFIYRSTGASNAYLVMTSAGRVIVNAGGQWEAPHTRKLFDAVCPGPTPYIVTTQGHGDHIGGVEAFREPGTVYIAHENFASQVEDDQRIFGVHGRLISIWFPAGRTAQLLAGFAADNPGVSLGNAVPKPDLTFGNRIAFTAGDTRFELIAAVGETLDSAICHLPDHRIAFVSNMLGPLFPHFPNLNTLRGQRYRWVGHYLDTINKLRDVRPELLITGRGDPIGGADFIDRCLDRLYRAVDYVHRETLQGMNDGKDIWTLMREIQLPPELRVGQGYGKVAWGVRTIWESYLGWFHHQSTTELYGVRHSDVFADVADLAGPDALVRRAWAKLDTSEPVAAIHLAEIALAGDNAHRGARAVLLAAHQRLLDDGGDVSFWEHGWLKHEIDRWSDETPNHENGHLW
jgi:glyoxylase-like metal-dependent hydrolase (beta-lactamase superfamily II)